MSIPRTGSEYPAGALPSAKSFCIRRTAPSSAASRRLFEACSNLASEEEQVADETGPEDGDALFELEDEEVEEYRRERRAAFAARETARRGQVRETTREGFERGRNNSWSQLLEEQPGINSSPALGLLESATADTYLAIDRLSVLR